MNKGPIAKIRWYGDRDSVITMTRTFEHRGKGVIIYQVETTSPLSEGPVRKVYEWRFVMDDGKHLRPISSDYYSQNEAAKAAITYINFEAQGQYPPKLKENKMTNEEKLRESIRKIIRDELQLEKAPQMKTGKDEQKVRDMISDIGNMARLYPKDQEFKNKTSKTKAVIKALQNLEDALKR